MNLLVGPIPYTIGNLIKLEMLYVDYRLDHVLVFADYNLRLEILLATVLMKQFPRPLETSVTFELCKKKFVLCKLNANHLITPGTWITIFSEARFRLK